MDIGHLLKNFSTEGWAWYDPGSRIFYLNLVFSVFIALLFFVFIKKQPLKKVLSSENLKKYWFHPSAQIDYQIYILNAFIKSLFFAPVLGLSMLFSKWTIQCLYFFYPDFSTWTVSGMSMVVGTLVIFIWDDGLRFIHHYLMHRVSFLWNFHKVHHSAEVLTPITLFRIHPIESLIASFRNSLSFGLSGGVLMFLYSGRFEVLTLLGVNIFVFLFNFFTGNLRHSHISIGFGKFERLFMSPKQHHIHHSLEKNHFDKNFGVALSVWDQMMGTFLQSKNQEIGRFGLNDLPSSSLKSQLISGLKVITILSLFVSLKLHVAKAYECSEYLINQNLNRDSSHLKETPVVNSWQLEFSFKEWEFAQVLPHQVDYDIRSSWVSGEFRLKIKNPWTKRPLYFKAYFKNTDHEKYFYRSRFPIALELKAKVLRGRFEFLNEELVFIIYGFSDLKKESVGVKEIHYFNK